MATRVRRWEIGCDYFFQLCFIRRSKLLIGNFNRIGKGKVSNCPMIKKFSRISKDAINLSFEINYWARFVIRIKRRHGIIVKRKASPRSRINWAGTFTD